MATTIVTVHEVADHLLDLIGLVEQGEKFVMAHAPCVDRPGTGRPGMACEC